MGDAGHSAGVVNLVTEPMGCSLSLFVRSSTWAPRSLGSLTLAIMTLWNISTAEEALRAVPVSFAR